MYTATYDPADDKLRLSAATRLDAETYQRVKAAGFGWAPKQGVFYAVWSPSREDLLLDLAGEIDDEDTSLVERAEQRAERFEGYSERREKDAERARDYVSSIADGIPLGQPILVGHHSEKHARKDAERIENGMRKAVKMWETSKYWESRAKGALMHAKYKELPAVRARRIKGLEADHRREDRAKQKAQMWLHLWSECAKEQDAELQNGVALRLANMCWLHLPRVPEDSDRLNQCPTAYDALTNSSPTLYAPRTLQQIFDAAETTYPRTIASCERWMQHLENRLIYERTMLAEDGASELLDKKPRPKQLPLCNYRAPEGLEIENIYHRGEMNHYPQVEMKQAEYADIWTDYKGTRVVEGSHRVRTAMIKHSLVCVFLTDSKVHEKPAPVDRTAALEEMADRRPTPRPYVAPEPTEFDAMKDALRSGVAVQVVSAPQLFPTPSKLAARVVTEAGIKPEHRVLEPSGGTGALLDWVFRAGEIVAVEINQTLADNLQRKWSSADVRCTDFLTCNGDLGKFDRIIMNPPFVNGADIQHIKHAVTFLKPGGRLVAICANGPRQQAALKPLAEQSGGYWEDLPAGTFADQGTNVNTAMLVIEG
jgi:protein-L-isoaspartate O-methyltransferase